MGLAMQFFFFFARFVIVTAGGLWHESQWHLHTFFLTALLPALRRESKATFYQMCHSSLTKSFEHSTINSLEFREGPLSPAFQ